MKAVVHQQQLAHGVSTVSRAVTSRSTLAVLSNILIKTDDGRLRLSATNLELGISAWIGAKVEQEGGLTVPARTFVDMVSNLPNEEVTLTVDEHTQSLNVKCGTLNTDIKGISAEEFPPMPTPNLDEAIALNIQNFKDQIQQVVFAASTDDARPNLTGVHMTFNGFTLEMAATDGYRISIAKSEMAQKVPQNFEAWSPPVPWQSLAALPPMATRPS